MTVKLVCDQFVFCFLFRFYWSGVSMTFNTNRNFRKFRSILWSRTAVWTSSFANICSVFVDLVDF